MASRRIAWIESVTKPKKRRSFFPGTGGSLSRVAARTAMKKQENVAAKIRSYRPGAWASHGVMRKYAAAMAHVQPITLETASSRPRRRGGMSLPWRVPQRSPVTPYVIQWSA